LHDHHHAVASDCVGFTLPGIIDEPGSFSGMTISPRPERGPDASHRTSLAIFISATANCFSAPDDAYASIVTGHYRNSLGAVDERMTS